MYTSDRIGGSKRINDVSRMHKVRDENMEDDDEGKQYQWKEVGTKGDGAKSGVIYE